MKTRIIIFCSVIWFSISCGSGNKKIIENEIDEGKKTVLANRQSHFLKKALANFSLPNIFENGVDSNTLIFSVQKTFDTSYVIQFHRSGNEVFGVLYEVLPEFGWGSVNKEEDTLKLLFFDGYSFRISLEMWNKLINEARPILEFKDSSYSEHEGCLDCDSQIFALGSYIVMNTRKTQPYFLQYQQYVKDSVIRPLVVKRIPVLHRIKK